ncbi:MAG: response regulator [Planctomycetes bacterium]|nr:response regulator [Planctomycetota bacterium]
MESVQDYAIFLLDPQGYVLTWNVGAERIKGYRPEEVIGQHFSCFYPADDLAHGKAEHTLRIAAAAGHSEDEGWRVRKDGSRFWANVVLTVLSDQKGNLRGFAKVTRDLTARREAEEQARQLATERAANEALVRAARLKDEFLASMSHELRTPLNAILGMSEALQEQVYGSLNDQQQKSLHSIEESGRHLLALINDLLDLSKIEAGKMPLEIAPVSVEAVAVASLRLIKQAAHQKRLKVSSSLDSQVTSVAADERRLKQMLVNLLSNAVKFTPDGRAIGLEVRGDAEARSVHFVVWDEGIGIAPEDVPRLFQTFMQLDSGLSREYGGTGLGLALVRRMAEMHGGSVGVESALGQGSRFTISLPWHSHTGPDVAETVAGQAPAFPSLLRQALIVEDSPAAAEQLVRYCEELGAQALVHGQAEGAVARALEMRPDVILLDIQLPDLPGWQVLTQLKTEPGTKDIPVIIITVVDEPRRGLALGAAAYLVKPISRQQLQHALNKARSRGSESGVKTALVVAPEGPVGSPSPAAPLILLAEDNPENTATVSGYLAAKGYRLVLAGNGMEAIDRARETSPDVILMDIQMPGMDGLEGTRRIRACPDLAGIPVI